MPNTPYPITVVDESGNMTAEFQRWVTAITNSQVIVGTGSPEGIISSTIGRMYMDDAGIASSILYVKRDADIGGDDTKGWILV